MIRDKSPFASLALINIFYFWSYSENISIIILQLHTNIFSMPCPLSLCIYLILSPCVGGFPPDLDKEWTLSCRLGTKALLFRTVAICIGQNWHKHYQPVQSTVSPSLPLSTGQDCGAASIQPAVDMTVQSQDLDSSQKTMPGLLPRAFGDQWRELGLFTSTSFTFKIIAPAFSTMRALCVGLQSSHV